MTRHMHRHGLRNALADAPHRLQIRFFLRLILIGFTLFYFGDNILPDLFSAVEKLRPATILANIAGNKMRLKAGEDLVFVLQFSHPNPAHIIMIVNDDPVDVILLSKSRQQRHPNAHMVYSWRPLQKGVYVIRFKLIGYYGNRQSEVVSAPIGVFVE